jgi:hypothetical protein
MSSTTTQPASRPGRRTAPPSRQALLLSALLLSALVLGLGLVLEVPVLEIVEAPQL